MNRNDENDNLVECDVCHGSGVIEKYHNEWDLHNEECPKCLGIGKVEEIYDQSLYS